MTDIQKKMSDLEYKISMINLQDHLSSEDYERLYSLTKELKELKEIFVPSGYYIILKGFPDYSRTVYFSGEQTLTCSNEPVYFETKEEAIKLLEASDVSKMPYEIRKVGE